ncbi:carboxypeptidase regulatory-like domain-containing protein [Telmatobacter bradus]|uniref:TonB-dependent receptor n=1 Tax=Telmatobacter bradus TaxID=474953 RepID=UPI003B42A4EC
MAQSQSINGTIRGTISDASGNPIVGAKVVVTNKDTGYTRTLVTSEEGVYIAPNLPLGLYTVAASSGAFAPYTQTGISLSAGNDLTVNAALKVGSVSTEVKVTADASILETTQTDLGRTIAEVEVQNQPLTSRNPYNFILFQPGVSGHPNNENGIPRTVNTNGLVDRINYQLDGGVDTETDRYGLRLFAISDSYVKEVETVSNAFNAEFGNTSGIIYNVITPSGTNNIHGVGQYLWRPEAASACPSLQNCAVTTKPDLHVDDVVGSVGGPAVKNRFFYYAAYEHLKRANPQALTITSANQTLLENDGISSSLFETAPQVQRAQWLDTRGDYNINAKNSVFIRYNYFRNTYPYNTNAGGLYALDAASDFRDRAHIIAAQLITTFSPTLLNEFRGSWPYRNEAHINSATTGAGPVVTISGVANFGGSNGVGDRFQEKVPSFSDNLTWIVGKHQFKYGVTFQRNDDTQLQDIYTQYTFASIAEWLSAKNGTSPYLYSSLAASIGHPGAGYQSTFFGFFAQDSWRLRRNLTANYGLRYDQYRAPAGLPNAPLTDTQSFNTPLGDFAPRLGLAYSPTKTTVVRLSGGIFYAATPTNAWYTPLYNNGLVGTGSYIASVSDSYGSGLNYGSSSATDIAAIAAANAKAQASGCLTTFPASPSAISTSCIATQSITTLSHNFKNEYTWNGNLQVAQQLGNNDSLTLGYVLTLGRNSIYLRNSNLINPTGYLADGRAIYSSTPSATTRANPNFNNITTAYSGSNSSYNALVASYEHRTSLGLTVAANYVWSHSISNTPEGYSYEFSGSVEDPDNPKRDRGNSGVNRPNSFTLSTTYSPTVHFENKTLNSIVSNNLFAVLGNFATGDEQTITTSTHLNGDSTSTSRPLNVGRNTVRAPNVAQLDLRYTRQVTTLWNRIKPSIFIEANNLPNHINAVTINTAATTNSAGVITKAPTLAPTGASPLEARILQFGAKFDF